MRRIIPYFVKLPAPTKLDQTVRTVEKYIRIQKSEIERDTDLTFAAKRTLCETVPLTLPSFSAHGIHTQDILQVSIRDLSRTRFLLLHLSRQVDLSSSTSLSFARTPDESPVYGTGKAYNPIRLDSITR